MEVEKMNVELEVKGRDIMSTLLKIRDLGHEGWRVVSQIQLADKIFVSLVREAPRSLPV